VDVDGNELLDFTFNSTSLIHGYAHPAIVEAIKRQAERGTAWNAPNPQLVQLAELLCTRIPSVETVRFCNSGTEANMQALKAARAFTGRDLILKMQGAYHGTYEGVELNMAAPPLDARAAPATAGVPRNAANNVVMATFNERDQTAELIRAHAHELAAVLVTPILTRPGLGLPSAGYLEFLRRVTRENGVLLIFDEVISLRVAFGGAQDMFDVVPDLTAMGKIIGGGLPIGAFGGRAEIMRLFAEGEPPTIAHAGTFNGNPLTAAAGLTAMELLTSEMYARLGAAGQRLQRLLQAVVDCWGLALDVTCAGSLVSLDVAAEARSPATLEFMRLLQLWLLTRAIKTSGLLAVSTVTTDAHVDHLAAALDDGLRVFGSAIEASAPALRATPQRA